MYPKQMVHFQMIRLSLVDFLYPLLEDGEN